MLVAGKPVVLTGAMRPSSARHADGPGNLVDAIVVAASKTLAGVVVVFAGEIHTPRDVRKAHPRRLDAFTSGEAGLLGRVALQRVETLGARAPTARAIGVDVLSDDPDAWPWVEIVTSAAGVDGRAVAALIDGNVDGIVVAATGNGTVHHRLEAELMRAVARGVAVVRSSRCLDGSIVDSEVQPLPSASALTPVKARVELILDLLDRPKAT